MSDENKPPEEGETPKPKVPILDVFVDNLHVSDRISLAALLTAVVATIIGVLQTGFMWAARNDEVEAALRSEQLRACVAYRIAGENVIHQAQALGGERTGMPEERAAFEGNVQTYQERLSQVYYLLPESGGREVDDASRSAADALAAYRGGDFEELAHLSAEEGYWATTHWQIIDQCQAIIRDIRDAHVRNTK